MSRQIQIRRGTAAEHGDFTGAIGEITMDTTNNNLRVHDGSTVGGHIIYNKSDVDTALSGKADTATTLSGYGITDGANIALSNLTTAGKQVCSNLPMPSDRYDDLTLGASGTVYTAPADGWFTIQKATGVSGATLNFRVINDNSQEIYTTGVIGGSGTADGLRLLFPVKKNDKCTIGYSATGTTVYFRFVYAEGEK